MIALMQEQLTKTEYQMKYQEFLNILRSKKLKTIYQQIMDIKSGEVFGYEGLTRGPVGSPFYSPISLFPFAEQTGHLYSLEKTCRELAFESSKEILNGNHKLFINISAHVIYDPFFTPGHTMSLLKQYHLSPQDIVFEITERSAIEDYDAFRNVLNHYRNQGFQIAIDDAGAGYSSLQAITELAPEFIKVDKSLIQDIANNDVKVDILKAFTSIAQKIGSKIIAEGIETEEELKKVIELGIDLGQGYYFSKPANPVEKIDNEIIHSIKNWYNYYSTTRLKQSIIVQVNDEIVVMDKGQILKKFSVNSLV
ncbi:EAL domain-containing protein [Bacillus sp. CGMCC 1.16607]|uniref:EAL domain-containing protein n=1 Tax=Bacillus sp. CGMCC 1.16607 TaxID=3351842 RepID=UPI00362F4618